MTKPKPPSELRRPKRTYSEHERSRALALSLIHGPVIAAEKTGIPSTTIAAWRKRDGRTVAYRDEASALLWQTVEAGIVQLRHALHDPKVRPGEKAKMLDTIRASWEMLNRDLTAKQVNVKVDLQAEVRRVSLELGLDPAAVLAVAESLTNGTPLPESVKHQLGPIIPPAERDAAREAVRALVKQMPAIPAGPSAHDRIMAEILSDE